jgi:hypothetical protein
MVWVIGMDMGFSPGIEDWLSELYNPAARSTEAGSTSVHIPFPEVNKQFVSEKLVVLKVLATVLTGVHYQVPGLVKADNVEVTIVDVHINQKGKTVIRKAIVGMIDGQFQPQNT